MGGINISLGLEICRGQEREKRVWILFSIVPLSTGIDPTNHRRQRPSIKLRRLCTQPHWASLLPPLWPVKLPRIPTLAFGL